MWNNRALKPPDSSIASNPATEIQLEELMQETWSGCTWSLWPAWPPGFLLPYKWKQHARTACVAVPLGWDLSPGTAPLDSLVGASQCTLCNRRAEAGSQGLQSLPAGEGWTMMLFSSMHSVSGVIEYVTEPNGGFTSAETDSTSDQNLLFLRQEHAEVAQSRLQVGCRHLWSFPIQFALLSSRD